MSKPLEPLLEWKRGVRSETAISTRMTWSSKLFNFQVQECTSKYEKTDDGKPWVYYYAIKSNRIIGRHRKKHKAVETCEKRHRKDEGLPTTTRKKRKRTLKRK